MVEGLHMRTRRPAFARVFVVLAVLVVVVAITPSAGVTGAFATEGASAGERSLDGVETEGERPVAVDEAEPVARQIGAATLQQSGNETEWEETVTGTISNERLKNPFVSYRLDVAAGDTVTAELDRTGGSGTLNVLIFDQELNLVASTGVEPNESGQVSAVVENGGEYGVSISAPTENDSGEYALTVSVGDSVEPSTPGEPGTPGTPGTPGESATPGETEEGMVLLEPGEPVEGEVLQYDEAGIYVFEGEAGDEVSLELARVGGEGRLYLGVYDEAVEPIGFIEVEPGATERLRTVLPASGMYYVAVSGGQPGDTGAYTLTMNVSEDPVTPPGIDAPETDGAE